MILVAILDVLSEVQELAGALLPRSEAGVYDSTVGIVHFIGMTKE